MRAVKVIPKTFQALSVLVQPRVGNQPESLPWILYDTKTYTSGSTTKLTFFDQVSTDKSISNMEAAGSLPDPQFFEIFGYCLDILQPIGTATTLTASALDNVNKLVLQGRGIWTFNLSNKRYGPFPITALHALGGPTGFLALAGTFAAPNRETVDYANNGIFDGGWWVDGSIVIPPKVGFDITLEWPSPLTLTGTVQLRVSMVGVLHRRVL
jgi:hypothetical protein